MRFSRLLPVLCLFLCVSFLSGCSQVQLASHVAKKATKEEKSQGRYKVGSPYKVSGIWYHPQVDYNYNETGIASWYGPNFHGKPTANGETFDQNELTAAHKTLPLPSLVRVTNLENGKALVLRVNDRGPFKKSRIIDVSKRGAELLGFKGRGVAKVRVQVLSGESQRIADIARQGGDTRGMEVPLNDQSYAAADQPPHKIPGHTRNGAFYPDEVVQQVAVSPTQMYVQAGSFSVQENAFKYAQTLQGIGEAKVFPATINNIRFYRVRIPVADVVQADSTLMRVLDSGNNNAIVVVDETLR